MCWTRKSGAATSHERALARIPQTTASRGRPHSPDSPEPNLNPAQTAQTLSPKPAHTALIAQQTIQVAFNCIKTALHAQVQPTSSAVAFCRAALASLRSIWCCRKAMYCLLCSSLACASATCNAAVAYKKHKHCQKDITVFLRMCLECSSLICTSATCNGAMQLLLTNITSIVRRTLESFSSCAGSAAACSGTMHLLLVNITSVVRRTLKSFQDGLGVPQPGMLQCICCLQTSQALLEGHRSLSQDGLVMLQPGHHCSNLHMCTAFGQ